MLGPARTARDLSGVIPTGEQRHAGFIDFVILGPDLRIRCRNAFARDPNLEAVPADPRVEPQDDGTGASRLRAIHSADWYDNQTALFLTLSPQVMGAVWGGVSKGRSETSKQPDNQRDIGPRWRTSKAAAAPVGMGRVRASNGPTPLALWLFRFLQS